MTYRPRAALFNQGDSADSVLYIEKGRVEVAVMARSGKVAICGLLGPGAFVGEDALCGRSVRRESAIAMTPTEALVVSKAQMEALLRTQPAMRECLTEHIVTRGLLLQTSLADQLLNLSEQRLARSLLVLAGCDLRRPCSRALLRVSQETIAEMVGTTRSRVNVFMGKFKKLGFIEEGDGTLLVRPSLMHLLCAEELSRTEPPLPSRGANGGERASARWNDGRADSRDRCRADRDVRHWMGRGHLRKVRDQPRARSSRVA